MPGRNLLRDEARSDGSAKWVGKRGFKLKWVCLCGIDHSVLSADIKVGIAIHVKASRGFSDDNYPK